MTGVTGVKSLRQSKGAKGERCAALVHRPPPVVCPKVGKKKLLGEITKVSN